VRPASGSCCKASSALGRGLRYRYQNDDRGPIKCHFPTAHAVFGTPPPCADCRSPPCCTTGVDGFWWCRKNRARRKRCWRSDEGSQSLPRPGSALSGGTGWQEPAFPLLAGRPCGQPESHSFRSFARFRRRHPAPSFWFSCRTKSALTLPPSTSLANSDRQASRSRSTLLTTSALRDVEI